MPRITTHEATGQRWDDVVAALTGGGDGGSCWCQWWYLPGRSWSASGTEERRDRLRDEIAAGPPRGIVAYVDGAAAGWCRVAPRVEQPRLARARIPKAGPLPMADPTVWAITCLEVRREHRGLGLTHALVAAAVELARSAGATAVEAYPIDTTVKPVTSNALYLGAASVFAAAGFAETARPTPARPVMTLRIP